MDSSMITNMIRMECNGDTTYNGIRSEGNSNDDDIKLLICLNEKLESDKYIDMINKNEKLKNQYKTLVTNYIKHFL